MKFELVTPEKLVLSCEAKYVQAPGTEGDFGVLDGHAPVVSTLRNGGVLTVTKADGGMTSYTLTGGFAEVNPESVIILAEGLAENLSAA